jgi:hypothetical protein
MEIDTGGKQEELVSVLKTWRGSERVEADLLQKEGGWGAQKVLTQVHAPVASSTNFRDDFTYLEPQERYKPNRRETFYLQMP